MARALLTPVSEFPEHCVCNVTAVTCWHITQARPELHWGPVPGAEAPQSPKEDTVGVLPPGIRFRVHHRGRERVFPQPSWRWGLPRGCHRQLPTRLLGRALEPARCMLCRLMCRLMCSLCELQLGEPARTCHVDACRHSTASGGQPGVLARVLPHENSLQGVSRVRGLLGVNWDDMHTLLHG